MSEPEQDQATVRTAYDEVAEDYARLIPDVGHETSLDLAMIDALSAAVAGGRVLDAGCGAGRVSRHLADRGVDVEGVDLSPGMIAMARRDHPGLRFSVASLTALPYPDASFDGVLLWYSTIHTPLGGQPAIYREVTRVLRPGGHVLVGFQSGAGVHDTAPTYRQHGHDISLVRYRFTADDVAGWMAHAGLSELARLVRRPAGPLDRDDQGFVLGRRS